MKFYSFNSGNIKKNNIKLGVIGFGKHMTGKLIPAIKSCGAKVKIIAGCRINKLEETQKKYNLKYVTNNYERLIKDSEIDAIVIALPDPNLQAKITKEAIKYGKNVFVEKPISYSLKEIKEITNLAKKNNVIIYEGLNLFHLNSLSSISKLLRRNELKNLNIDCAIQNYSGSSFKDLTSSIKSGIYFAMIHPISVAIKLFGFPDKFEIGYAYVVDDSYSFNVYLKYKEHNIPVELKFNTMSKKGFNFCINYVDIKKCEKQINIKEKKLINGISTTEKKDSYRVEMKKFFSSIKSNSNQDLSNKYIVNTHKLLEEIFNKVSQLYKPVKSTKNNLSL